MSVNLGAARPRVLFGVASSKPAASLGWFSLLEREAALQASEVWFPTRSNMALLIHDIINSEW